MIKARGLTKTFGKFTAINGVDLEVHRGECFGLLGPNGAGKTTFISRLLAPNNIVVSSPTFALYNTYTLPSLTVIHADLYRLTSAEDVDSAGFWDLFSQSDAVILTEWVDRVDWQEIPLNWTQWIVKIDVTAEQMRSYSLFKVNP